MDTSTKSGSSGLHIALAKASSDTPYLGDPKVIDGLVRSLISGSAQRNGQVIDGELSRDDAIAAEKAAVTRLANILAGNDADYETVGDWNPHGLAAAIRKHMSASLNSSAANDDYSAVLQACANLLLEVSEVLNKLARDGDEHDAKLSLEGIAGDYTHLFAGLPVDGDYYLHQHPTSPADIGMSGVPCKTLAGRPST